MANIIEMGKNYAGILEWVMPKIKLTTQNPNHPFKDFNPKKVLNWRGIYLPEKACIKDVYGAACVQFTPELGDVYMITRNGIPTSTSTHLHEYSPKQLMKCIELVTDPERQKAYLRALELIDKNSDEPHSVYDCSTLHQLIKGFQLMATPIPCLMGHFDPSDPNSQTTRTNGHTDKNACPHSKAGCTERILLSWTNVAYLLKLNLLQSEQNGTPVIYQVDYSQEPVVVRYFFKDDLYNRSYEARFTHSQLENNDELENTQHDIHLWTQTTPCSVCTTEVPKNLHVKSITIDSLSRHKDPNDRTTQILDEEDVSCLDALTSGPINIYMSSIPQVKYVSRQH